MIGRCYCVTDSRYSRYGGRGITVCIRWLASFESFYKDMGSRPSSKHSLERVNNDGNYCPENCVWGTHKEQSNNRSSSRRLEYKGKNKTLAQWALEYNINTVTLSTRLKQGWNIEAALTYGTTSYHCK